MAEEKKEQVEVGIQEQVHENNSVVTIEAKQEIIQTENSSMQQTTEIHSSEVKVESTQPNESAKKKNKKKKKKKVVKITDDDFGPVVDFTKNEGFVYDPEKAELKDSEVHLERRPWEIQDVRSIVYLRRLGIFNVMNLINRKKT